MRLRPHSADSTVLRLWPTHLSGLLPLITTRWFSSSLFQTPPRGGRPALRRFVDGGYRSAYLCPGFRPRASLASPYLSIIFGR